MKNCVRFYQINDKKCHAFFLLIIIAWLESLYKTNLHTHEIRNFYILFFDEDNDMPKKTLILARFFCCSFYRNVAFGYFNNARQIQTICSSIHGLNAYDELGYCWRSYSWIHLLDFHIQSYPLFSLPFVFAYFVVFLYWFVIPFFSSLLFLNRMYLIWFFLTCFHCNTETLKYGTNRITNSKKNKAYAGMKTRQKKLMQIQTISMNTIRILNRVWDIEYVNK